MHADPIENPYAAPTLIDPYLINQQQPNNLIFRSGKYLVMHKNAQLPDRCVKSNLPTSARLKRKLAWHNPLVFLLILIHVLLYVIVALAIRKTATIYIPLLPKYKSRRLMWILVGWTTFFLAIGGIVMGVALSENGPETNWIAAVGFISFPFLLLMAGLIGIFGCRVVYAKKIEGDFVKLGGICEDFLSSLPNSPNSLI